MLAGGLIGSVPDQVGFDLAGGSTGVDEGLHQLMAALLAFHQAAAVHHAEWLDLKACLGRRQRDAVGDHLGVAGGQADAFPTVVSK